MAKTPLGVSYPAEIALMPERRSTGAFLSEVKWVSIGMSRKPGSRFQVRIRTSSPSETEWLPTVRNNDGLEAP